jgi:hypothetical protein
VSSSFAGDHRHLANARFLFYEQFDKFRVRTRNTMPKRSQMTDLLALCSSTPSGNYLPRTVKALKVLIGITILLVLVVSVAGAQSAPEPIKKVQIGKNREFLVNGKPFLPIMSWAQPPKNYKQLGSLGFNAHAGGADPVVARECGAYVVPGFRPEKMANDNILGWIFDDEPDMPQGRGQDAKPRQQPENVIVKADKIKAADPERLLFMTLTGHFTREQSTYSEEIREQIYPGYIKQTDVIGFDIYPIYGSGYASHLDWVGKGVAQLKDLAGERPVYAWIETSKGSKWMSYEKQPDVLPIHTRNEVWQAIIRGATAIGYFTHAWFPEFKEFAPTAEMQEELGRLNSQLSRLAPVILAPPAGKKIEMNFSHNLNSHFKATETGGRIYIFAQNIDLGPGAEQGKQFEPIHPRNGVATFLVEGLKAGAKIEVIDEGRTIVAEKGSFTDAFNPLAEHIYSFKK